MRSNYCGELRKKHINSNIQLCGWVDRSRDHGGVIFIDLRDITGTIQITVDPDQGSSLFSIARAQETPKLRSACPLLTNNTLDLENTTISSAEIVEANSFRQPGRDSNLMTPAFCRVVGVTDPAINFEVWLPLDNWNGKYNGVGNGGMAGVISYSALASALTRGYAAASTDTGHDQSAGLFDASWASGRQDLIEDFGHRALPVSYTHLTLPTKA